MKESKNQPRKKHDECATNLVMAMLILILMIAVLLIAFTSFCMEAMAAEEPYIDEQYWVTVEDASEQYNVDPYFISAIIWTESRWDVEAENNGCYGLMQIYGKWHQDRMTDCGVEDLMTSDNIYVGCNYIAELFEKYEDPYLVLMIYNQGYSAIKQWEDGEYSYYATSICNIAISLSEQYSYLTEAEVDKPYWKPETMAHRFVINNSGRRMKQCQGITTQ